MGILVVLLTLLWQRKCRWTYLFCFSVFWLYLLSVIAVTIFPIPRPLSMGGPSSPAHILSRINLLPFYYGNFYARDQRAFTREIIQNILMTVPFGFGVSFIARLKARDFLWLAVAVGLSTELAQLAVSLVIGGAYRGVDINDVLLNAAGVLIGYACFGLFRMLVGSVTKHRGVTES
jgi:glycopeptide antibiotics resistance protein